jgi:hypothetical protein
MTNLNPKEPLFTKTSLYLKAFDIRHMRIDDSRVIGAERCFANILL